MRDSFTNKQSNFSQASFPSLSLFSGFCHNLKLCSRKRICIWWLWNELPTVRWQGEEPRAGILAARGSDITDPGSISMGAERDFLRWETRLFQQEKKISPTISSKWPQLAALESQPGSINENNWWARVNIRTLKISFGLCLEGQAHVKTR